MPYTKLDVVVPEGVAENWAACQSYEGYEASDQGRVRRAGKDRVLAQRIAEQGYAAVTLSIKAHSMVRFAHALVMDAFVSPRPLGHMVQHIDGDKLNNALTNLRYAQAVNHAGEPLNNLSRGAEQYLPPDAVWVLSKRGAVVAHAPDLDTMVRRIAELYPTPDGSEQPVYDDGVLEQPAVSGSLLSSVEELDFNLPPF